MANIGHMCSEDTVDEAAEFYADPYENTVAFAQRKSYTTHMVLFGDLLRTRIPDDSDNSTGATVQNVIEDAGWSRVWYGFNGFDTLQDDTRKRGGVHVYHRPLARRKIVL